MVYSTAQELATDPNLKGYAIDQLQNVNVNGIQAIYCRIRNGGTSFYNSLLGNYSSAFVQSFIVGKNTSGCSVLLLSVAIVVFGIFFTLPKF
jgi:hypothetical protein